MKPDDEANGIAARYILEGEDISDKQADWAYEPHWVSYPDSKKKTRYAQLFRFYPTKNQNDPKNAERYIGQEMKDAPTGRNHPLDALTENDVCDHRGRHYMVKYRNKCYHILHHVDD